MKKSDRLKPVQRLSESREQNAARALGESNQAVEAQEQRLSELEEYRSEYYKYVQERGANGVTAGKLQDLQRFLNNLNMAIEQQKQVVEMARQEREQMKGLWQQAHGKHQALSNVVERYREDERLEDGKREQKDIDEHAQGKRGKH
jgi:flagellar FliJ protein